MSRPLGTKNKTPSKKELTKRIEQIERTERTEPSEQKSIPPSFGRIDALVVSPRVLSNNPVELLKLNRGFVGVCNTKNATTIASTPLRLFAVSHSNSEKIVFPHKKLNKVEVEKIKVESKSYMVKQAHNVVEITEHPVYEVLNNINDDLDYYDLMELTASYLGMIGNAYWEIIKKSNGLPQGITVLPAEYTCVTLDDTMHIKGYRLFNGIYQREFDKKDVIHFKNCAPGLFWRVWNNALITGLYGMGDVEYVLDEVYLYNSINDYLRALTENNSIPSAIIKYTGGRLDKKTMEDVQKQWDKVLRTWKRAGKTKVMDQDFDWQPISLPPKDLEFGEGRKWLRGVIANAFGVPEDLITTENANRASSNVAISNYMRFSIKPRLKRIEERLNNNLIKLYDDNLFFKFDNPIPNDEALEIKREQTDLQMGVLTVNEVRRSRGLLDVEWGNVPYNPPKENIRPSEAGENQGETMQPQEETDNNPVDHQHKDVTILKAIQG